MRAIAVAVLLFALPAAAAEPATRLLLSETASREVADDRYVATLAGIVEAEDAATAQAELNRTMREALAAVEGIEDLRATTEGYWVQARERDEGTTTWIARQSLRLESADRDRILSHVGTLQTMGLATQQLGSMLSRQGHEAQREDLIREALVGLRLQAETVATVLDQRFLGFAEIDLDGARPMPMPRAMAMEARADAPVMTEGSSTVSVTVRAIARLGGT